MKRITNSIFPHCFEYGIGTIWRMRCKVNPYKGSEYDIYIVNSGFQFTRDLYIPDPERMFKFTF